MLRNRFSAVLLALLVAAAMPIAASAEEVEQEPAIQTTQVINEELQTPEAAAPQATPEEEQNTEDAVPADVTEPTDGQPAAEQTADDPAVSPEEVLPPVEEAAAVTEPAIEAEPEEAAPTEEQEGTESAIEAEPEVIAPAEEPVVTEPAIMVEEIATEQAIVVEPEAATLTITHRLIIGDKQLDGIQTIEGLEVGQTIDLTQYIETQDWEEYLSQTTSITLDKTENEIVLEYGVKADSGVIVVIEDSSESADVEMK